MAALIAGQQAERVRRRIGLEGQCLQRRDQAIPTEERHVPGHPGGEKVVARVRGLSMCRSISERRMTRFNNRLSLWNSVSRFIHCSHEALMPWVTACRSR